MKMPSRKKIFVGMGVVIPLLLAVSLFAQFSGNETMLRSSDQSAESTRTSECKYYGYWDYLDDPEKMRQAANVGMSYNAYSAKEIIEDGLKVIINISHQLKKDESEAQWISDLRGTAQSLRNYSSDEVLWIMLWDEPYNKDRFTTEELEQMINVAREVIGDEYKYGFTFTEGNILDHKLPTNIDVAGINYYPFFKDLEGYQKIYTRDEFFEYFHKLKGIVKQIIPDVKISITGQGFYGGQWRKPPVESAKWYVEATQDEDVISMVYWKFRSSRWQGVEDMPKFFEAQTESFNSVCPQTP